MNETYNVNDNFLKLKCSSAFLARLRCQFDFYYELLTYVADCGWYPTATVYVSLVLSCITERIYHLSSIDSPPQHSYHLSFLV